MEMQTFQELLKGIKQSRPDFYRYLKNTALKNTGLGAVAVPAPAAPVQSSGSIADTIKAISENIGTALTGYYGSRAQKELMTLNLELARQGRPTIDPSSVAPTFRVDVDNPQIRAAAQYLPFILAGGAVLYFISKKKSR